MDHSRGEGSKPSTSGASQRPSTLLFREQPVFGDTTLAHCEHYCDGRQHSVHLRRCQMLRGASWHVWKQLTLCLLISLHLTFSKPVCKYPRAFALVCQSHCHALPCFMLGVHMQGAFYLQQRLVQRPSVLQSAAFLVRHYRIQYFRRGVWSAGRLSTVVIMQ